MACLDHYIDPWYQDTEQCPIPISWVEFISSINFIVGVVTLVYLIKTSRMLSELGKARSANFRNAFCAIIVVILTGPAMTSHAFGLLPDYWFAVSGVAVFHWSFFVAGCLTWPVACNLLVDILGKAAVQMVCALEPTAAEIWRRRGRHTKLAAVPIGASGFAFASIGLWLGMRPVIDMALIVFFCLEAVSQAITTLYLAVLGYQMHLLVKHVAVGDGTEIEKTLRFYRNGILGFSSMLGGLTSCYAVATLYPEAWRNAGFLFVKIVAPQICLAAVVGFSPVYLEAKRAMRKNKSQLKKDSSQSQDQSSLSKSIAIGVEHLSTMAGGKESASAGTVPPVWERGVSMVFLQRFKADVINVADMTTADICHNHVKPLTEAALCSIWEALHASSATSSGLLLGKQTCMVSHAWSYKFTELLSIIKFYDDDFENSPFYFIDIFSMNQHDLAESQHLEREGEDPARTSTRTSIDNDGEVLLMSLKRAISTPGQILLCLDPWRNPTPLTRCWCLFEVYIALVAQANITVKFSPRATKEFFEALKLNPTALAEIVDGIDVQEAEALRASDKKMILSSIARDVGFADFNTRIQNEIKKSMRLAAVSDLSLERHSLTASSLLPLPNTVPMP
eukprot:gnl/MRDRNA2_/MRDRNA2_134583_c0_seq1.p1 gnl/MRDRNA2_/MRDRNA2_134583_c0~~gnl/MRDRNA2_/MRDRNA2_134583_c0_seq1.p1  ORF type:complete len:621 (-),score=82.12 gnl/MRDRNA2_/MRDRNA2_134583_c0_seq1:264-2126(-)